MSKIYFHIDVNNAFLSWEAIYRLNNGETLDIRNVEAAVAGDPKKRTGVILAKSNKAKKMGVKTGEAIFEAKNKCPNLLLFEPHYTFYETKSLEMKKLLKSYSDNIYQFSIDEFFIEYVPLFGTYLEVAKDIQKSIFEKLGFTVNIGISDTKYLAKIASDFEKPNKIHTLFKSEIKEKLWPLKIEEMFLLGPQSAKKLKSIGINTIGELANTDVNILKNHLKSLGQELYGYAWGNDLKESHSRYESLKSISHSKTFIKDLTNLEDITNGMLQIANENCIRLRKENLKTNNICITLKTNNFNIYSSSSTIPYHTDSTKEIFNVCKNILNKMYKGEAIRLIGVSLNNLNSNDSCQLNIFETLSVKNSKVDHTVDDILFKFNDKNIVTRGTLIMGK